MAPGSHSNTLQLAADPTMAIRPLAVGEIYLAAFGNRPPEALAGGIRI
jgi:hypothetical protein